VPADPDALREAFYKYHGGSDKAANAAWNRALEDSELDLFRGKLDFMP
jgi:hypothetical protein